MVTEVTEVTEGVTVVWDVEVSLHQFWIVLFHIVHGKTNYKCGHWFVV